MKILYVLYKADTKSHQKAIQKLRDDGHEVMPLIITAMSKDGIGSLKNKISQEWGLCIWNIHQNMGAVRKFQRFTNSLYGHLSIEHDILGGAPDVSVHAKKECGVFSFQKHNTAWLKKHKKCSIIKSQWNKVEIDYDTVELEGSNIDKDAIYIGTHNPRVKKYLRMDHEDSYFKLFRKIWYKPYLTPKWLKKGTIQLPKEFWGTEGTYHCSKIAKIWFTYGSSSYMDALLYGCIPILLPSPKMKIIEKKNSYLHKVKLFSDWQVKQVKFNALVCTKGIGKVIKKLQSNDEFFQEVLEKLKDEWWDDEHINLLPYSEALSEFVKNLEKDG
jgi:hypothetical protein